MLQDKIDAEIDKLVRQVHIKKIEDCSDKYSVSPIVMTVKKDGLLKLALEAHELSKEMRKNKYLMPINEEPMETVGQ